MLITNKQKGGKKGESKRDSAGRVRRAVAAEAERVEQLEPVPHRRMQQAKRESRTGGNVCPVCCTRLLGVISEKPSSGVFADGKGIFRQLWGGRFSTAKLRFADDAGPILAGPMQKVR